MRMREREKKKETKYPAQVSSPSNDKLHLQALTKKYHVGPKEKKKTIATSYATGVVRDLAVQIYVFSKTRL